MIVFSFTNSSADSPSPPLVVLRVCLWSFSLCLPPLFFFFFSFFAHSCPLNNAACQPDSLHGPKQSPRSATEGHISQQLARRPPASALPAIYRSLHLPPSLAHTHTHTRRRCTKTRATQCDTQVAAVVTDAGLINRAR